MKISENLFSEVIFCQLQELDEFIYYIEYYIISSIDSLRMHHTQKFQVPIEFQPSFTQIPLFRVPLNPRQKVSTIVDVPVKGKSFLPTLKTRNNSSIQKIQTQISSKDKSNIQNILKASFGPETKTIAMISSSVIYRSSESQSKYIQPNEKYTRYKEFLKQINLSNGVQVSGEGSDSIKKFIYYIGKGNNHSLVQSILKSRFWWTEGTYESANFVWTQIKKQSFFQLQTTQNLVDSDVKIINPTNVHNHLPGNNSLGNKKSLYQNLKEFCAIEQSNLFDIVPLTFHIGAQLQQFKQQFYRREALKNEGQKINNIWIIKPGQNSNRGQNIVVIDSLAQFDEIHSKKSGNQTLIAQLYISKPFLYNRRKFDIRHYMMITSVNGLKGYWYKDGYIRTSSHIFQAGDVKNTQMHLTNDAIQKYSDKYGKYEEGNKISYKQFQRYLNITYPDKKYDFNTTLDKMKEIATLAIKATAKELNPATKPFNFEIFGLDFMLDEDLRPWLIEVNTNPCLQLSCRLLNTVIPPMLQNSFRLALDPLFPPPNRCPNSHKYNIPQVSLHPIKYELVFDSSSQGNRRV